MKIFKFILVVAAVAALSPIASQQAGAHCQVPCGIYDDAARFVSMREHVTTIEKAMGQIATLAEEGAQNANQVVRWVGAKETHADALSEIVTYYFMTQRIKVPADMTDKAAVTKYQGDLALLHQILVYSLKAKQTTDVANTKKLSELIGAFEESYLGKKGASVEIERLPYTQRLATLRG
ncbi:MAG: superoxide dismutase [Ni] [Verrucomicrobiales bacterium]